MNSIAVLKERKMCALCVDGSDESCFNCDKASGATMQELEAAFDVAIEALEKQEPQKMKKADIDFVIYGCQSCGKHDKHCPNCGQKLDWSEYE